MSGFCTFPSAAALPAEWRGAVVAIGNFDGAHLGHQAVLGKAHELAKAQGRPAVALTFEPHPRQFFRPSEPLFRLTPRTMKQRLIETCEIAGVIEQTFDAAFAACSAREFVERILVAEIGAGQVVVGRDFRFGKDRGGDLDFLETAGRQRGFSVIAVDAVRDAAGDVISSSRIRDLLARGEPAAAALLLGYRFAVLGTVANGRRLGRTLGYPTANLRLDPDCGLRNGIYAVRLRRADGSVHDGVASFGNRPTVEVHGEPLLEVHLFDFSGDLYGETVSVSLFDFLRAEERFSDLDLLKTQMRRDEAQARSVLAGVEPIGPVDRVLVFRKG